MAERITPHGPAGVVAAALDWAYSRATSVLPGLGSAEELAARHLSKAGSTEDAIDELIRWQTAYAGAAGAVANLGGLLTLPVALPASMASSLLIQLRMVAAIAVLRGYDPGDERVKAVSFLCLAGSTGSAAVGEAGLGVGARLLKHASSLAVSRVQRAVAARLGARLTARGAASGMTKLVPVLGGLVGGGIDAMMTRAVGAVAKQYFPPVAKPAGDGGPVIEGEPVG